MEKINSKLLSWASILDEGTRLQAELTSTLPFIHPHIALMPDAHLGKGATIGSVIPTQGAIVPAAVGVDIGCGMIAVQTQFTRDDVQRVADNHWVGLRALHDAIADCIPLSKGNYNNWITPSAHERIGVLERTLPLHHEHQPIDANWRYQLGSLGSGNHFIEVSYDETGQVWLFLHSGSRGVGNRLAVQHIKVAQKLAKKFFIKLPDPELAYLPDHSEEFGRYVQDVNWAQKFALFNREEMMDRVVLCVEEFMDEDIVKVERINCHHNFTQMEHHFGQNLWITRKGAIKAMAGDLGMIPGSMGTASYVVEGLGNAASMNSAPHGAGRAYSRTMARKTFSRKELDAAMEGIVWGKSDAFLDEIPGAYKDIDVVMNDAKDLVKIKHTLHQLLNVKGD